MSSSFLESTQQSLPQIPKDLLKLVRAAKACHQPTALSQAGGWIWSWRKFFPRSGKSFYIHFLPFFF